MKTTGRFPAPSSFFCGITQGLFLDDFREFLNRSFLLREDFRVNDLDAVLHSVLRFRKVVLRILLNICADRNRTSVSNLLLCFLAQQVINKFLCGIEVLGAFEDSNRARNHDELFRVYHLEMCALCNLVVCDVVNCEACGELAGGRIIDNLAGAFANACAVGSQTVEVIPAELMLKESNAHVGCAGKSRVSDTECFVVFRLRCEVFPSCWEFFDLVRVDCDTESTETCCREGAVVIIKRIQDFVEKPVVAQYRTISCGIYVIRRRLLIELLEKSMDENRYDFVQDILIRYRGLKRIYGYRMESYWSNIASIEDYYRTNMDFLKAPIRDFFFRQYPEVHSRAADLPPAKYNVGVNIKNSLLSSGCIVNGTVENSILFHQVYVGNNCVIRNSLILNDVYIGDNTIIENCIVESGDTIQANSCYRGENGIKIVIEKGERYTI